MDPGPSSRRQGGHDAVTTEDSAGFCFIYRQEVSPMKSYRKELWFETPGRRAFLNITPQIEAALKESGVQ